MKIKRLGSWSQKRKVIILVATVAVRGLDPNHFSPSPYQCTYSWQWNASFQNVKMYIYIYNYKFIYIYISLQMAHFAMLCFLYWSVLVASAQFFFMPSFIRHFRTKRRRLLSFMSARVSHHQVISALRHRIYEAFTTLWFWGFWGSLAPHLVGKYISSLAP